MIKSDEKELLLRAEDDASKSIKAGRRLLNVWKDAFDEVSVPTSDGRLV